MIKLEPLHYNTKIQGTDIETKIMPLYYEGKTMQEIAQTFCIDCQKITFAINEYIYNDKIRIQRRRIQSLNPETIYMLKKSGKSYSQIMAIYNISKFSIEKIIKKYCEEHNIDKLQYKREMKGEDIDNKDVVKDLKNGFTLEQLSEKYNVTIANIRNRIQETLSKEEIRSIYAKNRTKKYVQDEKAFEILELFRQGVSKDEIALRLDCTKSLINNSLFKIYSKMGKTVPTIIGKNVFLGIIKKKNYTREEIIKEAERLNKIIPQYLLDEYFGKDEIDINKVRKFVIEQFSDKKISNENKKLMFKNFNVAKILKENGFDLKHQALALVYSLSEITKTALEDITKVLNNNEELVEALKTIMGDEYKEKDYLEELKKCEMAKNVKLAIMLEEIIEHNNNEKKLNIKEFGEYQKIAEKTIFEEQYNNAIIENENLFKGYDR